MKIDEGLLEEYSFYLFTEVFIRRKYKLEINFFSNKVKFL